MKSPISLFWQKTFKLPVSNWTLSGHSRSRERTGFFLKEPRVFLDAGIGSSFGGSAILITHGHFDHSSAIPSLLRNSIAQSLFLPSAIVHRVLQYTFSSFCMKIDDGTPLPPYYQTPVLPSPLQPGVLINTGRSNWIPMEPGIELPLYPHEIKKPQSYFVRAVQCFHGVTTVGYVISERRQKLKQEFSHLKGREIAELKKNGVSISEVREVPLLAFLCDSTIGVLTHPPQVAIIFSCPVIMIECTFLEDSMDQEATKRGHICWIQLRPFVEAHPEITFILFHFSLRYSNRQIREFFETASSTHGSVPNIVPWLCDLPEDDETNEGDNDLDDH